MPTPARLVRSYVRKGLVLVVLAVLSACASIPAELQTSRLALERGGVFSGNKYTFDGSEPEKVFNFVGFYNGSFRDVLSQQPAAMAEAESAKKFQYAAIVIPSLFYVYAISEMVAATDTDGSIAGASEASDHLTRASGAILGALIWNVVLNIPIRNRLHNSVRMFNAGLSSSESEATERGLAGKLVPNSFELNPVTGQIGVGWRFPR